MVERQFMLADQVAETGFQAIFGIRAPLAGAQMRFRPKIARVGGSAAEIERDQVVFLIVPDFSIGIVIGADLGSFEPLSVMIGGAHRRGPTALANGGADILFGDCWIDRAGGEVAIGQGGLGRGEGWPYKAGP